MLNKKGQIEIAIMKGIAIALIILGGVLIYETITATTPEGIIIKCNWDCSNAKWTNCINGIMYRDTSLCVPKDTRCQNSNPLTPSTKLC